ncbi:arf-GAP with coiled-coil, ANK repeat and PH domain-containing protein 3 isoform X2 [Triplophysa dalaica]|uniref:arf-GAP with coiled-coil, ANK repeat and PH domain-containing protein 3 isoform X2 n=1 Tax=Triplophysa dalaica TaxID=1582913 RepID=UPI0024DFA9EC|nr:arf-GAP with coiled-coil, ANK repeat and PH domain-containing protein 3 isoform X2 [Triplophysa dalaica]
MTVDFEDCIKDSPRFRANIDEVETEVVEIEAKLDKECLEKCGESLQEIVNYHMILFDQAQRSVKQQLHSFVKEDVRKFKDTKKQFDKVREDLEIAQVKNAQAPRNKAHEVEEATCTLNFTRKCFRHLALDYVLQINVLQAKKKFEILDAMLSFMHAQYSLYQQGYNLLDEIDPYMKKLAAELDQLVIDSAMEKREMEHKHSTIQQRTLLQDFAYDDPKLEFNVDAPNGLVMEGYLFKRASNAFKTWNRRWFSIQNSQLVYQKKLKDSLTVVVEDLRLCSVKPCEDIERRFCFEVVSPNKSCMLQAESEKLRQAWIQAVQASIASAYRESPDNFYIEHLDRTASPSISSIDSANEPRERSGRGDSILQRILCLPGNQQCCDCSQADPRWASINLGVLLCIECSGIHRSLGVHCSKVRSLTLDSWEPELLKLMCELGNSIINHIYEGSCEEQGLKKPGPSSSRQEKEAWIKAKYVEKKFLKKMMTGEVLVHGGRKSERRWNSRKCRRHNSATTVPKMQRKYRAEPGSASPATLSSAAALERKFRRESLFCPDELDSLFSYFDTGSGPRSLSSDSGLGGSTDGSTDVLVFETVVDSVTEEECEVSEDSSNEVEVEPEASDLEDSRDLDPRALLCKACQARNLPVMAEALAHGADVNSVNEEDEGKSPLIQAVIGGSLIACEFLLQNSADVNQRDVRGRGPLHHATYLGHTGQVCLFLKRGATQNDGDEDGQDPLSIAVQAANADIVTLLRLARMNEEMRESEGPFGQPGDTTYLDIFREFSHMASHNPEKLKRRSVHFRHSFRV